MSKGKCAGKLGCSRRGTRCIIHKLTALLRLAADEVNGSFKTFTIKGILARHPHSHMIAVICNLVKHFVSVGKHFQQPIQSPLGFIEYIGETVRTFQPVELLSISKHFWEITISH